MMPQVWDENRQGHVSAGHDLHASHEEADAADVEAMHATPGPRRRLLCRVTERRDCNTDWR
jgi:hypothetical protein